VGNWLMSVLPMLHRIRSDAFGFWSGFWSLLVAVDWFDLSVPWPSDWLERPQRDLWLFE